MKKKAGIGVICILGIVLLLFITMPGHASAQSLSSSLGVVAYPSKGQSAEQQSKDEGECFAWAKQQTGIDPMATASAPTKESGPAVGGGERVRGAAGGAAGGIDRCCRRQCRKGRGNRGRIRYTHRRSPGKKEQGGERAAGRAGKIRCTAAVQQGLRRMHGRPGLFGEIRGEYK